ncbi:MAG: 3-isopropylmalate dehydrogenase [Gemmatimonadota bacterium]
MDATIMVLPGDGIGPEVTAEARRVLAVIGERFGHRFEFATGLVGGASIGACGVPLSAETLEACRRADAVLLGAVGGPRWDGAGVRPEQGLLALRRGLDVFANLRPIRVSDALVGCSTLKPDIVRGTDLLFVRELTGGLYFGPKARRRSPGGGEVAVELCRYSTSEIERVTRRAAALARSRRGKLTSVDKANVLETSRLWRETVSRVVRSEFPDLELEHVLVDACAMHLLRDPRRFDVILTENLFGDILTDEAAMLAGSIGVLPSASLGIPGGPGLFEPIHGSAPDLTGTGLANPYGAILSAAMLLRYGLGLVPEADAVEGAVEAAWNEGHLPVDLRSVERPGPEKGSGTKSIGTEIVRRVRSAARTREPIAS